MRLILLTVAAGMALFGQASTRDFLTGDEVDRIRLVQEPNERLKLYIEFAKMRVDMLQSFFDKEKVGRSALIHDTLEDFTKIIEAIDAVADDALKRKVAIDVGIAAVAAAEKDMLESLRKMQEAQPKDMARYKFALEQAIETAEDSHELSSADLKERATNVVAKESKEKKERDAMRSPAEVKESKKAQAKAEEGSEPKRKLPTLMKKGEVPPEKKQP